MTSPIFWRVLFFSLQRNFWIPQVAVILICNAPSVQFLIQQLNRTAFEWQLAYLQLPVSNWDTWILRTTHQECTISHHFEMKNSNFLGRGASILASSALDLRPPNVPVAFTPMNIAEIFQLSINEKNHILCLRRISYGPPKALCFRPVRPFVRMCVRSLQRHSPTGLPSTCNLNYHLKWKGLSHWTLHT